MVTRLECGDRRSYRVDDADTLMAENPPRFAAGNIPFEDMQIGAANCGLENFDDRIGGRVDLRFRALFQRVLAGAVVHKGFHGDDSILVMVLMLPSQNLPVAHENSACR
jgi:hypothetical protein